MSSYLVTGGAGFIGSALAARLLQAGHDVTIIDNLRTGDEGNIPAKARFIRGGVENPDVYLGLKCERFEAVYHVAGQSSGEISFDDPVYDLQTNTQSTLLLLKLAAECRCPKLIYASTMSVYGDQPDVPVSEDSVLQPKSFYGVGKVASEHYLRIYAQFGVRTTALRLFNVYGPGQNMANLRQGMVSIYLAHALKSRRIVVKGAQERFRDFVYIDDVVEAFLAAENNESTGFKVFNIATGTKTTVRKLLEEIIAALPYSVDIEFTAGTPGDQFGIVGNIERAVGTLGWRPRTSLRNGLREMVSWANKT